MIKMYLGKKEILITADVLATPFSGLLQHLREP